MAVQVSDLYAVRPICSECCCAFSAAMPCYRLDCNHLFCKYCLQGLAQGTSFLCSFDGSQGMVYQFDQQYIDAVEAILANSAGYSDPTYQQYLISVFTTLQSCINFTSVPCRAYMKTGNCPNVSRYCYYDHQGNALATKPCPLGPTCNRTTFCPYMHSPPRTPHMLQGGFQPPQAQIYHPPPRPVGNFPPQMQNVAGPQISNFPPIPPVNPPHPHSPHFQYHQMPKWYNKQSAGHTALVHLQPTHKRYREVETLFNHTSASKATIVKIERIQNKHLYKLFADKHETLSQAERRSLKLMHLFHGTRKYPPSAVYDSLTGLDPRIGHGVWGQGTYYASNSYYSVDRYGHGLPDGTQQIFCMLVLVGDSANMPPTQQTKTLVRPPLKQGTTSLFHSVNGQEGGSDIYVTYEANMSYPYYLITFR